MFQFGHDLGISSLDPDMLGKHWKLPQRGGQVGDIPDSTHRVGGIRVYTAADIRRMAEYFKVPIPTQVGEEGGHHD